MNDKFDMKSMENLKESFDKAMKADLALSIKGMEEIIDKAIGLPENMISYQGSHVWKTNDSGTVKTINLSELKKKGMILKTDGVPDYLINPFGGISSRKYLEGRDFVYWDDKIKPYWMYPEDIPKGPMNIPVRHDVVIFDN